MQTVLKLVIFTIAWGIIQSDHLDCGDLEVEHICGNFCDLDENKLFGFEDGDCVRDCICKDGYIRNGEGYCEPVEHNNKWLTRCQSHEHFVKCGNGCEQRCDGGICNSTEDFESGCVCKPGTFRTTEGTCVEVCENIKWKNETQNESNTKNPKILQTQITRTLQDETTKPEETKPEKKVTAKTNDSIGTNKIKLNQSSKTAEGTKNEVKVKNRLEEKNPKLNPIKSAASKDQPTGTMNVGQNEPRNGSLIEKDNNQEGISKSGTTRNASNNSRQASSKMGSISHSTPPLATKRPQTTKVKDTNKPDETSLGTGSKNAKSERKAETTANKNGKQKESKFENITKQDNTTKSTASPIKTRSDANSGRIATAPNRRGITAAPTEIRAKIENIAIQDKIPATKGLTNTTTSKNGIEKESKFENVNRQNETKKGTVSPMRTTNVANLKKITTASNIRETNTALQKNVTEKGTTCSSVTTVNTLSSKGEIKTTAAKRNGTQEETKLENINRQNETVNSTASPMRTTTVENLKRMATTPDMRGTTTAPQNSTSEKKTRFENIGTQDKMPSTKGLTNTTANTLISSKNTTSLKRSVTQPESIEAATTSEGRVPDDQKTTKKIASDSKILDQKIMASLLDIRNKFHELTEEAQKLKAAWVKSTTSHKEVTHHDQLTEICEKHRGADIKLFRHPKSCTHFYQCHLGKVMLRKCPDGLHYDGRSHNCHWPEEVKCDLREQSQPIHHNVAEDIEALRQSKSEACRKTQHPFLWDDSSCRRYWRCETNGKAEEMQCAHGEHFDMRSGSCKAPQESECRRRLLTKIRRRSHHLSSALLSHFVSHH